MTELFTEDEYYEAVAVWKRLNGLGEGYLDDDARVAVNAFLNTKPETPIEDDMKNPDVAKRIRLLLSPHAAALYKACLILDGEKNA